MGRVFLKTTVIKQFMNEILLLEDDLAFSISLTKALKSIPKVKPITKSNKGSFTKRLEEKAPELVIINLDNPTFDFDLLDKIARRTPILFYATTYSEEVYEEIKRYNFIGYLIRPINVITAVSIVEGFIGRSKRNESKNIFYFRKKGRLIPIIKKDIEYIQTEGNYCKVKAIDTEYILRYPLGKFIEDLNFEKVIRAHRRYAVNVEMVELLDISNNHCLINGRVVPIGRLYKKNLKKEIASNN